jgi:hypothetical protein
MGPMLGPAVHRGCASVGFVDGFHGDGTELNNRCCTFQRGAWCSPAARRSIAPGFLSLKRLGDEERGNQHAMRDDEVNPDGSRPRASSPNGRFPSA